MRSLVYRGSVLVLLVVVSAGAFAAPRPKQSGTVRTVRQFIRALGDLITVPTPAPAPGSRQP